MSGNNSEVDLLYGVPAIAEVLGLSEKQARHRIDAGDIPAFRIGGTICARRSTLSKWLSDLETMAPVAAPPKAGKPEVPSDG